MSIKLTGLCNFPSHVKPKQVKVLYDGITDDAKCFLDEHQDFIPEGSYLAYDRKTGEGVKICKCCLQAKYCHPKNTTKTEFTRTTLKSDIDTKIKDRRTIICKNICKKCFKASKPPIIRKSRKRGDKSTKEDKEAPKCQFLPIPPQEDEIKISDDVEQKNDSECSPPVLSEENKPKGQMYIFISELSSLAGRHPHKPKYGTVVSHILKHKKDGHITNFINKAKQLLVDDMDIYEPNCDIIEHIADTLHIPHISHLNISHKDICNYYLTTYPQIKQRYDKLDSHIVDTSQHVNELKSINERVAVVADMLSLSTIVDEKEEKKVIELIENKEVKEEVEHLLPAIHGRILEDKAYPLVENCGYCITDKQFIIQGVRNLIHPLSREVKIYGKVDGIDRQRNLIIEIKNRKNRFFDPNPGYDIDQLSAYVALSSPEIVGGVLAQVYNGETRLTTYPRNELEERFNEILASETLYNSVKEILDIVDCDDEFKIIQFAEKYLNS